jgi:hypothetical protein
LGEGEKGGRGIVGGFGGKEGSGREWGVGEGGEARGILGWRLRWLGELG